MYELKASFPAWECKNYDPEDNTCEGTWRGSVSDLELVENRQMIDEIRGDLEDLAREGVSIRVKQSSIVRTAVRDVVTSFISGIESETLYDGEKIQSAVDDALEQFDAEDETGAKPAKSPETDDGTLTELNQMNKQQPEATTNGQE